MAYWTEHVLPSIQAIKLDADDLAAIEAPVLTIHGTRDRSAPYGGGRDWSRLLPNARLLTVEHAAHAPWIEAPGKVFGSIETFLNGAWPNGVTKVESLDPQSDLATQT
jgi:pimeloyl-ACP methyl ester carboxylesterase